MEPVFRHILVTTDFSAAADHALPVAFALARQNEARLTLCHVLELTPRPSPLYPHYAPRETLVFSHEVQHAQEDRARALLLERLPEDLRSRADIALPHGPAAEEILEVARTRGADLIVLAPHGKTGLLERLLGGVAYKVVRHAHCPVLMVR